MRIEALRNGLLADEREGLPHLIGSPTLQERTPSPLVLKCFNQTGEELEIPAGMTAVRSPTDGVFYRRPSPDADPYVVEGSEIERGSVLALVEVMKCFNQIAYGRDEESPEKGRIHRVLADDAHEVRYGQVLFIVEPA